MSKITLEFTYSLPDERFATTSSLSKSASWTYYGPEKFYVYINSKTNKVTDHPPLPYEQIGDNCPTMKGMYPVLVDANEYPLLATLFYPSEEHNTVELEQIILPDGRIFEEDYPLRPIDCYDRKDITYNVNDRSFIQPFPFLTNDITWDDIRAIRDIALQNTDMKVKEDAPDSYNQPWIDFRQALRDLPTVWADRPAYSVIFPDSPDAKK